MEQQLEAEGAMIAQVEAFVELNPSAGEAGLLNEVFDDWRTRLKGVREKASSAAEIMEKLDKLAKEGQSSSSGAP